MRVSARNQINGTVVEVKKGAPVCAANQRDQGRFSIDSDPAVGIDAPFEL